jgi:hypothetical protein
MYVVGAHMDGWGFGEATDDDGSGTALVVELARIFSDDDVVSERSIRFALWNSEESGQVGSRGYCRSTGKLLCRAEESPPGSGRYQEPKLAWNDPARHDASGS